MPRPWIRSLNSPPTPFFFPRWRGRRVRPGAAARHAVDHLGRADRHGRARRGPLRGRHDLGRRKFRGSAAPVLSLGVARDVRLGRAVAAAAHALRLRWLPRARRRGARADRSRRHVLGAGRARGLAAGPGPSSGRVGRERPGRDRADGRDARARDERRRLFWTVVREFTVEMMAARSRGSGWGPAAAAMRRVPLPRPRSTRSGSSRRPASSTARHAVHGSGFLAVFVAGILSATGRAAPPRDRRVPRLDLAASRRSRVRGTRADDRPGGAVRLERLVEGLALAVLLAFAIRPLVVGSLSSPSGSTGASGSS